MSTYLVPADANPDTTKSRSKHFESRITRRKVEFFLVSRPVGDVALTIESKELTVGIDHRKRVKISIIGDFIEAKWDYDMKFFRQLTEEFDDRVVRVVLDGKLRVLNILLLKHIQVYSTLHRYNFNG
jgi:hypothetical protein